jgi:cleavage and polyadenylation specificity factor subunit 2
MLLILVRCTFLVRFVVSCTSLCVRGYIFTITVSQDPIICRHLNKTVLENFVRPAVLITDAYNALNNQPQRKQRDQEFIGTFRFYSLNCLSRQRRFWWCFLLKLSVGALNNCCSIAFTDMILKVLRADGNVLLPIETAGRVLELILHLESVSAYVMASPPYI